MREIPSSDITECVRSMCIRANCILPPDIKESLLKARETEDSPDARDTLCSICQNAEIAESSSRPVCQDTGMACVFVELGQEVHVTGSLNEAIHEGVRRGYRDGYLRSSVVADPLDRKNTGDNTPAMITYDIVPGDRVRITLAPKGFGSENMSRIKMLKPSDGLQGVKDFVISVVEEAGPNPCPPVVVGVGIGGTFDKAALLAKKALLRSLNESNPSAFYAALEKELENSINRLGIGPQGFGGRTTALGVRVEVLPTHIAGLPVAVNLSCHVTRHVTEVL